MIRTLHALGTPSNRRTLTLLMVLITLSSITLAIGMAIIALFLDALFSGGPQQAAPWAVWAALVVVLYAAIEWPTEVLAQSLGRDYILRIHELLARRTIELPLGYFDVDRSGQIGVTATGGALFAANAPAMMVRPLMHGAVSSGMAGVFLVALDWRIGLLTIALSAVVWYRYTRLMAQYRTASRERDEHTEDTAAQVLEFAQVQPVLRAAGPDSLGERAIRRSIREQLTMLHHEQGTQQMVLRELSTIVTLGTVVIDGVATVLLLNQQLTAGTYIGIVVLVFILAKVALAGIPYGEGLQTATNTLEQVQEILDATCLSEPETPAAPEGHAIEFDGVDFGYEPGTPVVSGVSFRVEPGTTTALVGPSGSGKSTLLKLAARFYDVDAGSVRLGGQDVRDLGTRTVLGSLAMVFQDVYLFEDTLYENIRLGRGDATAQEVMEAAEAAGVAEIAEHLPQGFDTIISEGGQNLSGGQRQRVSIARALLKDAPVVLLDEATSSLDVDNEHLVMGGLRALSGGGRTTIVIAHRLHTIIDAEQIVVLGPNGQVEARGSHDELLASSPRYQRLWGEKSQAGSWTL